MVESPVDFVALHAGQLTSGGASFLLEDFGRFAMSQRGMGLGALCVLVEFVVFETPSTAGVVRMKFFSIVAVWSKPPVPQYLEGG